MYSLQGSVPRGEVDRILAIQPVQQLQQSRSAGNKRVRAVNSDSEEQKQRMDVEEVFGRGPTKGGNKAGDYEDDNIFADEDLESLEFERMLQIEQDKRASSIPASFGYEIHRN